MPRDAKSVELANQKAAYIGELLKEDPTITLLAARKRVQEKFKSALNFKRSRETFIAAGGKVRAKHLGKRRRKNASSTLEAAPKRGPGRPPKSIRPRNAGRRADDKLAALTGKALKKFEPYLVIINDQPYPSIRIFATREQAGDFLQDRLRAGTPATEIAAYTKDPIAVKLDV